MDEQRIDLAPETLEESLALLLTQVPAPVQSFVLNELGETSRLLMAAHNLHTDQAGVLERELLLMLLGQEEPAQFAAELKASGVPEATTQAILKDVNERVFKRLRSQERTEGVAPAAAPSAPQARSWVEVTPPKAVPLAQTPAYTPPAPPAPIPPPTPAEVPMRTMAADMARAQAPQTAAAPTLPGAPIPVPTPVVHKAPEPIPAPKAAPIARPAPTPAAPTPKSYGADPYREPIE